jgi:hypothetical protein
MIDMKYVLTILSMMIVILPVAVVAKASAYVDPHDQAYMPMVNKATDWEITIDPPLGVYGGCNFTLYHGPEVRDHQCRALILDYGTGIWENNKYTVAHDEYYGCLDANTGIGIWFSHPVWFNTVRVEQYDEHWNLVAVHQRNVGTYRACQAAQ